MSLELDSYYQNLMASKGRSASICAPGLSAMEAAAISAAAANNAGRRQDIHSNHQYASRGSGGSMHITANVNTTPTRPRKHGAHRSQSARVAGSQRPKIKRREQEILDYHEQHLDLASSEGALRDCQESYNPFLNKVPSTGRLVTSTSLEMSQNSLGNGKHGTPPPQKSGGGGGGNGLPLQQINAAFLLSAEPPRDSPHLRRRHSGGGYETRRRGSSDQKTGTSELDKIAYGSGPAIIPTLATPDVSPLPTRRGAPSNANNSQQHQQASSSNNKPTGLPKSPTASRSGSQRRVNSMKTPRRTQERYLDVPDRERDQQQTSPEDEDEESYRLRSFSVTPKGKSLYSFIPILLSLSLLFTERLACMRCKTVFPSCIFY